MYPDRDWRLSIAGDRKRGEEMLDGIPVFVHARHPISQAGLAGLCSLCAEGDTC